MPVIVQNNPSTQVQGASTQSLIDQALICPTTGQRMREPRMRLEDGWAYDENVAHAFALQGPLHTEQGLEAPTYVEHRLLRSLLALPQVTPALILEQICPITLEAPLALPTMSLSGHTYSGALHRWRWKPTTSGQAREPLTGGVLNIVQDDRTMERLIDVAASDDFPAHRSVLSGRAPESTGDLALEKNLLGDTPLSLAAKYGHFDIVKQLSAYPSDGLTHVNRHGRTAWGHAVANHHVGISMFLADAGAALGTLDAQTWTPWGRALWHSSLRSIDGTGATEMTAFYTVLSAPQSLGSIDTPMTPAGFTPMHLAARLGLDAQVIELFDAGADCDIPDATGVTVRQMYAHDPEYTWERLDLNG